MGSTRLPGKVMLPIGNRSLLGYLTHRLSYAETIDEVVVATSTLSRDDVVIEEAKRLGVKHFRGDEKDVLGRYLSAASAFKADIIVRVTADNPFTDPESIDRVVRHLFAGHDYAIERNLPVGTTGEALTFSALSFIDKTADTARWREHVTLYAKENPHMLRCAFLSAPPDLARPDLSYTVDHLEEYRHVQALSGKLPAPNFSLKQLIALADMSPVV
jgi:spore coat polysaccharide biosynthesis protein SpsF